MIHYIHVVLLSSDPSDKLLCSYPDMVVTVMPLAEYSNVCLAADFWCLMPASVFVTKVKLCGDIALQFS